MADYYQEFCEVWYLPPKCEPDKLRRVMNKFAKSGVMDDGDPMVQFDWDIKKDTGNKRVYLVLRSTDQYNSNAASAAMVISRLQQKYKDSRPWIITYSYGCSRLKAGEFGGGAIVVRNGILDRSGTYEVRDRINQELHDLGEPYV